MTFYTVQLEWWTPSVCELVIETDSPDEAYEQALKAANEEGFDHQRTVYDSCTDTACGGVWAGMSPFNGSDLRTHKLIYEQNEALRCRMAKP